MYALNPQFNPKAAAKANKRQSLPQNAAPVRTILYNLLSGIWIDKMNNEGQIMVPNKVSFLLNTHYTHKIISWKDSERDKFTVFKLHKLMYTNVLRTVDFGLIPMSSH